MLTNFIFIWQCRILINEGFLLFDLKVQNTRQVFSIINQNKLLLSFIFIIFQLRLEH